MVSRAGGRGTAAGASSASHGTSDEATMKQTVTCNGTTYDLSNCVDTGSAQTESHQLSVDAFDNYLGA